MIQYVFGGNPLFKILKISCTHPLKMLMSTLLLFAAEPISNTTATLQVHHNGSPSSIEASEILSIKGTQSTQHRPQHCTALKHQCSAETKTFAYCFKASSFIYFTEELLQYRSLSLVKFYSHASIENRVIFVRISFIQECAFGKQQNFVKLVWLNNLSPNQ